MNPEQHAPARLIPWYVRGTLDERERDEVDGHLRECAECRELLETARDLNDLVPPDPERWLDHPEARLLDEYVVDRGRLGDDARRWIEEHRRSCEACDEAIRRVAEVERALGRDEARKTPASPLSGGTDRRSILTRTLLHPALAAVYLLLVIALLPFALRGRSETVPAGTSITLQPPEVRLFPDESYRGATEPTASTPREVRLGPGGEALDLVLVSGLTGDDWAGGRRYLARLRSADRTLFSTDLRPDDVDAAGAVRLRVPRSALDGPGPFVVEIAALGEDGSPGEPLARAAFRVAPPR